MHFVIRHRVLASYFLYIYRHLSAKVTSVPRYWEPAFTLLDYVIDMAIAHIFVNTYPEARRNVGLIFVISQY